MKKVLTLEFWYLERRLSAAAARENWELLPENICRYKKWKNRKNTIILT